MEQISNFYKIIYVFFLTLASPIFFLIFPINRHNQSNNTIIFEVSVVVHYLIQPKIVFCQTNNKPAYQMK